MFWNQQDRINQTERNGRGLSVNFEKYQSHIAGGWSTQVDCSRPNVCIAFIVRVSEQLRYCRHSSSYLRDGKLSNPILVWYFLHRYFKKKKYFSFYNSNGWQTNETRFFFYSKVKDIKGYIYVSNLKMGYTHVNMSAVYCLQCYFYFWKRCTDVELLVHLCLVWARIRWFTLCLCCFELLLWYIFFIYYII